MPDAEHRPARQPIAQARTNATDTGRVNQKLRTRQALIDAARELLAAGASPTLAEIADHARISKTTAYRYFASADVLLAEVMFDRDFPAVDDVLGTRSDPTARVLAVEEAVNDAVLRHEGAMRAIVRNALERADDAPRRIGRRRTMIAAAVEPLATDLDPGALQQLRDALALVIGPEAILAARDVCGLDPDETRRVTAWAAEALVAHARAAAGRPRTVSIRP